MTAPFSGAPGATHDQRVSATGEHSPPRAGHSLSLSLHTSPAIGNAPPLTLRPIITGDLPFLEALYASTRQAEVDRTGWPPLQKQAFLRQQFQAQHSYYQSHIPHGSFDLLVQGDRAIGRLYLAREPGLLRLVDISLLPEMRGQGLGTAVIQAVMKDAESTARRVQLHVENDNPAYRLYQRLGFQHREDRGIYQLLEWQPTAAGG